jgi:hypothetical protein
MAPDDFQAQQEEELQEQYEVMMGCQDVFMDDDDVEKDNDIEGHLDKEEENDDNGSEKENDEEEQDDDQIWDLLGFGWDKDDDESVEPIKPPHMFIKLWTAISQWVTPEAVVYVRHLQLQQTMQQEKETKDDKNSSTDWAPSSLVVLDRGDVAASRFGGLMAVMHMHTARCLRELQHPPAEI